MQGNIVTAARWLGGSLVLASLLLVGGLHWTLSRHADRLAASMSRQRVGVSTTTSNPRIEELLNETEALREASDDFKPFWTLDDPSQLKPFSTRVDSRPGKGRGPGR